MPVYYKNQVLRHNGTLLTEFLTLANIVSLDFELIEDNNIDIDSIEKISIRPYSTYAGVLEYLEEKGNEIIDSLKQLNREIKELKGK